MPAQRLAQGVMHSFAKVAAALASDLDAERTEKAVRRCRMQLDRAAACLERGAHCVLYQLRMQAGCSGGAQARHEASLHPPGKRRAREHDDDGISADRRIRAPGAAAPRPARTGSAAAT